MYLQSLFSINYRGVPFSTSQFYRSCFASTPLECKNSNVVHRVPQLGISAFEELSRSKLFVYKSLILNIICNLDVNFILLSAPRRFGKTSNLSLIKTFFELRDEEKDLQLEKRTCSQLFSNKKIGEPQYTDLRDRQFVTWANIQ